VGRLLAAIDDGRGADETLVVYTSDHGNHFRTRNVDYKRSCHDASIRVPLVLRGPGFRGGVRCDSIVSLLDLVPTLVTSAGGDDPGLDGRPLQHAVTGDDVRDDVFVQISESQIGRAIRTRTHTYGVRAPGRDPRLARRRPGAADYVEDHLYDNRVDPHQANDLVDDPAHADLRDELRRRLLERIEQFEAASPHIHAAP
jgi:arylsulfatase A-like enzyme